MLLSFPELYICMCVRLYILAWQVNKFQWKRKSQVAAAGRPASLKANLLIWLAYGSSSCHQAELSIALAPYLSLWTFSRFFTLLKAFSPKALSSLRQCSILFSFFFFNKCIAFLIDKCLTMIAYKPTNVHINLTITDWRWKNRMFWRPIYKAHKKVIIIIFFGHINILMLASTVRQLKARRVVDGTIPRHQPIKTCT